MPINDGYLHVSMMHPKSPGYRIYLAQEGKRLIILFGGGTKASQKADIRQAKDLLAEYKNRKSASKRQR